MHLKLSLVFLDYPMKYNTLLKQMLIEGLYNQQWDCVTSITALPYCNTKHIALNTYSKTLFGIIGMFKLNTYIHHSKICTFHSLLLFLNNVQFPTGLQQLFPVSCLLYAFNA